MSFEEARKYLQKSNSTSSGLSGTIGYGGFSLGGGRDNAAAESLSEKDFDKWQTQNCSTSDREKSSRAFQYFAQSVLAPNVVNAWRDCMLKRSTENLTCFTQVQGSTINFVYNWKGDAVEIPKVASSLVVHGNDVKNEPLLPPGTPVYIGENSQTIPYDKVQGTMVRMTVVLGNRYSYQCGVWIPPAPSTATAQSLPKKLELQDSQVANVLESINSIEIKAAKLALKKTSNAKIKEFATDMVRDHFAITQKLSTIVRKLSMAQEENVISYDLEQESNKKYTELSNVNGLEFDRRYAQNEISYHSRTIDLILDTLMPATQNVELKSLLSIASQIFRGHKQHIEQVNSFQ